MKTLPPSKKHLGALLTVPLLLWLVGNGFITSRRIVSFYTPLPVGDYWRVVENLPASVLVLAVPFLLQWTLMQLAATCSFVFLSRAEPFRNPKGNLFLATGTI